MVVSHPLVQFGREAVKERVELFPALRLRVREANILLPQRQSFLLKLPSHLASIPSAQPAAQLDRDTHLLAHKCRRIRRARQVGADNPRHSLPLELGGNLRPPSLELRRVGRNVAVSARALLLWSTLVVGGGHVPRDRQNRFLRAHWDWPPRHKGTEKNGKLEMRD